MRNPIKADAHTFQDCREMHNELMSPYIEAKNSTARFSHISMRRKTQLQRWAGWDKICYALTSLNWERATAGKHVNNKFVTHAHV